MRSSAEIINEEDEDLEREVGLSPGKDNKLGGLSRETLFVKESFSMPQTLKSKSRYNTFDES